MDKKPVLTVSQLNNYIKLILENDDNIRSIYVKGEVSNFVFNHNSKHFYFTLKDDDSSIKVVMFKEYALKLPFVPTNGMKLICFGKISLFEKAGTYQLYAEILEPEGIGTFALEFENLKKKLSAQGLFDESIKKKIPKIPLTIGIVSSSTGAAVRDIINVAKRRNPLAKIVIYPVLVQGEKADKFIADAIKYFNEYFPVDVMIVGRGGGSTEDLWVFNSELIASAIFSSKIPIISAVGHETDFTICDFVADVRAATPSVAAEIATPNKEELLQKFENLKKRLKNLIDRDIKYKREQLSRYSKSVMLKSPMRYIDEKKLVYDYILDKLKINMEKLLKSKGQEVNIKKAKIQALSPISVLNRGYSIITAENGKPITSIKNLQQGKGVVLKLSDGSAEAKIEKIQENKAL